MTNYQITLFRDRDVAKILNISVSSVWRRVQDKTLPPPIRIGRATRWPASEINEAVEKAKTLRDTQQKSQGNAARGVRS